MPPPDNGPTGPAPDGKKASLGKRFLDRVKGPKSTKSSSASSTPATQSMENRTGLNWPFPAPSAANEKPLLSKYLLTPLKGSKFIRSSSAPSTPAAQSAENFATPGVFAAQPAANVLDVATAHAVPRASASSQVVTAAGTTSAMNVNLGILATPDAVAPTSAINVDQHSPATPASAGSVLNINEHSSMTAVPNVGVFQTSPARNAAFLTNMNQSALPVLDVSQDQSKFKEYVNVALDGFLTALRVAKEASDWNPFLKAALGGVVAVVDLAKTVHGNSQDMKDTLIRIQGLLPILETSAKRIEVRKDDFGKGTNLMTFAITMKTELEKIQQMQSHGLFRHVLQGPKDAATLLDVYKNISEALEQFKVAFLVAIEQDTSTIRQCPTSALTNLTVERVVYLYLPSVGGSVITPPHIQFA
ncbi:hypothetical protein DXG01_003727 [Tephrocybe rancida]|nr:hypothetical protein DXG01_003727 [Tephrocybe rancida]